MSTRTRTHCPGCGSLYEPRVRKCTLCGRARDQMSDAEAAAQLAPPQPVAPTAPMKMQPTAFSTAPAGAPPTAPVQAAPKSKKLWAVAGALAFIFVLFKIATRPPTPDRAPPPAPVAYVPSAQEKAQAAKRAADDAKFWAAKEKTERAEVSAFTESQQPLADVRQEQIVQPQEQTGGSYVSEQDQPNGPRFRTPNDNRAKSQHVSGYRRKDGTWVDGYNRRHR